MVKDIHIQKVDLRVPLVMYERIEIIAEETNQPFTPKTKNTNNPKRAVTPIILKLIEVGLKAIDEDSSMLTEDLVTPEKDNSETIENRIYERLTQRLNNKLDELIGDKLGVFEVRLKEITEAQLQLTAVTNINPENKESAIENNSEKIDPPEDTEAITPEVVNEFGGFTIDPPRASFPDTEAITPEVVNEPNEVIEIKEVSAVKDDSKTFEDTVKKIKKLNSQGLNYSQIAKKLTEGNYPTKQGSLNWVGNQVKRILSKP